MELEWKRGALQVMLELGLLSDYKQDLTFFFVCDAIFFFL